MAVTRQIQTNLSGSVTPTTGQVKISEVIDWTDVPARLAEIFGPTTGTGIVATELDPLFGLWRAQNVEFKPLRNQKMSDTVAGASAGDPIMPVFTEAELNITYSSIEQESPTSQDEADQDGEGDPVPFLTHSWSIGGDFITMDDTSMYWSLGASAKGTGIAANKIIPSIEHSINWKRVLNPPFGEIRNSLGKVNSKNMTFSTGLIYPECLLFNGAEMSRDIMSDGTRAWDVTYRFSERRVDATLTNHQVYPITGLPVGVAYNTYDGTGPKAVDLSSVLPGYSENFGGKYGGWNHFYKKDATPGMYRLHQSKPAVNAHLYHEGQAIYKKYDLLKLFEQDS